LITAQRVLNKAHLITELPQPDLKTHVSLDISL
jgi:hypothetical protein